MTLLAHIKMLFPRTYRHLPPHLRGGRIGEDAAARYLIRHGYRIEERNFVSGKNEIDIIAFKNKTYVFCEVKARVQEYGVDSPYGCPASAVTDDKKRHLISAAMTFERKHLRERMAYRFDVIEVYLTPTLRVAHIHYIKNAFTR